MNKQLQQTLTSIGCNNVFDFGDDIKPLIDNPIMVKTEILKILNDTGRFLPFEQTAFTFTLIDIIMICEEIEPGNVGISFAYDDGPVRDVYMEMQYKDNDIWNTMFHVDTDKRVTDPRDIHAEGVLGSFLLCSLLAINTRNVIEYNKPVTRVKKSNSKRKPNKHIVTIRPELVRYVETSHNKTGITKSAHNRRGHMVHRKNGKSFWRSGAKIHGGVDHQEYKI